MGITCKIVPCEEFVQSMGTDSRSQAQGFKDALAKYMESLEANKTQNEKALVANVLAPFLQALGFRTHAAYKQKGNSEIDLALLKDGNVEIMIETKKPENLVEMLSANNPNCKALHECILYYLREREGENQNRLRNASVRYVMITNFYQFYVFSALEFKRLVESNKEIQKIYKKLNEKGSLIENQNDFYAELSKVLDSKTPNMRGGGELSLQCTFFDLRNDKHVESASKILNKEFLHHELKKDSNALNPKFYFELLHILGLKEKNEGGKILIGIDQNQKTSFAKHIASKLESQNQPSDFETTMSHIILWLNRILFLKLIEANLLHFNDFDKSLRFLTSAKITSFNTLAHLFFDVLAKDYAKRDKKKGFDFLPYLNSSLFIRDEKEICDLSALDDDLRILPFDSTQTEHQKEESVRFLAYLFDFLECFDFGKSPDSGVSDKLIKSSVLGAMFEKLNGYQEGSFYTPNFITAYMCKESLQKIVLDKFNTTFGWNTNNLESLRKQIDRNFGEKEAEFRRLLESIRICDPSVGSGHFLVSALNEMIAIYHRLGLLGFGYKSLDIQDDEILLTTKNDTKFAYQRFDDENHQIQIALFNLKKSIIENNLFGVDINPNSCNIARLRLWIELLKNAYYLNFAKDEDSKIHKLQTLPNIDINIKCGNSLVSYFDIQTQLAHYPNINHKMQDYKQVVQNYKEGFYQDKSQIDKQIKVLLQTFKNFCFRDKFKKEIKSFDTKCEEYSRKYGNYLAKDDKDLSLYVPQRMFVDEFDEKEAQKEFETLKNEYESIFNLESNKPFEWRFAFPEVLNSNGDFLGFDLVIGNPPYIRQEEIKHLKPQLQKTFVVYKGTSDIYTYFYEQGYKILKQNGILNFITSNKWCRAAYGEPLRKFLLENTTIHTYLDLNGVKVFESATVDTSILEFHKGKADKNHSLNYANPKDYNPKDEKPLSPEYSKIAQNTLNNENFIFSDSKLAALKAKIESIGTPLKDWDININYGIKTGYNEAFIINTAKREEILSSCRDENERARTEELIKPILRGRDIKRYSYEWAGLWIILAKFDSHKYLEKDYPTIYNHLLQYKDKLQARGQCRYARGNKADTGKGYLGQHHWLELDNNPKDSYLDEFAKSKIVWNPVSGEYFFSYIKEIMYFNNSLFMMTHKQNKEEFLLSVLGLMNSKLYRWLITQMTNLIDEGKYAYGAKEKIEKLPIPKINKKQENEFVELVREIVQIKQIGGATEGVQNEKTKALESRLDSMVYALYGLDSKEIEIIGGGGNTQS